MMAEIWGALRRSLWQVDHLLDWLISRLQHAGLVSRDLGPDDALERAVRLALLPVAPSASFRQALRSNLSFAAQGQRAGLTVECPKPLREGIIVGVSAGLLVAAIATLVVVFRSRVSGARG